MRRFAFALILTFVAAAAFAKDRHSGRVYINDNDGLSSAERCSGREVFFDNEETYVQKEVINAGNLASFKASVENAPVDVTGDSPSGYTITVCKAAAREVDLDRIKVSVENGELRTSGPEGSRQRWTVLVHVSAPRGANVSLETENGPLSVSDFDGKVSAHAQNGPLSINNVTGTIDATTSNGPISISGSAGNAHVQAKNGPLSVDLDGASWRGELEASTSNGPLSVSVPRRYGSGVVVEARGHGPISCHADACGNARMVRDEDGDWNEPRTFELGSGTQNVHLWTVNGPLTIRDE